MYKSDGDRNGLVNLILEISQKELCNYFGVDLCPKEKIWRSFSIQKILTGFNYGLYMVDFKDTLKSVCIKYTDDMGDKKNNLILESEILKVLNKNTPKVCPILVNCSTAKKKELEFLVLELIEGTSLDNCDLKIIELKSVFDFVLSHEEILLENMKVFSKYLDIGEKNDFVDFESKIHRLKSRHVPKLKINTSLGFLNKYLNHHKVRDKRVLVTDRSASNFIKSLNGEIKAIDFSTIRWGTRFDNWIQFIEDPRLKTKINDNGFFEKEVFFYAASVYTNVLQGIFVYEKDLDLAIRYFQNANNSYRFAFDKAEELFELM